MSRFVVGSIVRTHKIEEEAGNPAGSGPDPEAALKFRRGNVWVVGVEVIQEGEEGAIRPPPAQPIEEDCVDLTRIPRLEADPFLIVEIAAN